MRAMAIIGAGVLGLTAVAGCGGGANPPRSAAPSRVRQADAAPCRPADLVWRPDGPLVPMTGEHSEVYYLVNQGTSACSVRGYPTVELYDAAGRKLPFRYAHGGGPYITKKKPKTVSLRPDTAGYVVIAKYRCDRGITSDAASVTLSLPLIGGGAASRHLRLSVTGPRGLSYCLGGPHDPGQLVTISPLVRFLQETLPAH